MPSKKVDVNDDGDWNSGKQAIVQKSSSQLLPVRGSSDGVLNIIHSMPQDHVTSHIRTDEMICYYGVALYAKKGQADSVSTDTLHRSSENLEDLCWLQRKSTSG